jgi:hypothetical protein
MKKNRIAMGIFSLLLVATLGYLALTYESKPTTYNITDASTPWQHRHTDIESRLLFFKGERLSIQVQGELDGTAEISYGGNPETIGPGIVSLKSDSPEWWCAWCDLSYKPLTAKRGSVAIIVDINN